MTGLVAGVGAKVAANALVTKATGLLSAIPKPVWEALAVIGYMLALIALHQHYARAAIAAAKIEQKAGDDKQLQQSVANEAAMRATIATQNAAIADLAAKSTAQQKAASEARQAAQERASAAEAVAQRMRASAAQRPSSGPCATSKALQEQWQ